MLAGLRVIVDPRLEHVEVLTWKPRRTHRKRRIANKWRRRFGMVPDRTRLVARGPYRMQDGTILVAPSHVPLLKAEA